MLTGNILITGGTGTLGGAILRRAHEENWQATFTVLSRDPMKQKALKAKYPDVGMFLGDVTDPVALDAACAGKDLIIHAAAMKHIPEAEAFPTAAVKINVEGSLNVLVAAHRLGVPKVLGISTDKACHPINVYGATKMLMERLFQQYGEAGLIETHLVRYGNVIGSTGSVVEVWKKMIAEKGKITATSPDMTRWWITADDAVRHLFAALDRPSAHIFVPWMNAMSMAELYEFLGGGAPIEYTGLRPGEKMHEEIITVEEECRTFAFGDGWVVNPPHSVAMQSMYFVRRGKTSDNSHPIDRETCARMFGSLG